MKDKIVNHLLSKYVLIPILTPKLIDMNVATRKGMGTKMRIYYTKKYINKLKMNYDNFYVLKCDISKYFYNIDHEILIDKLSRDIEDRELLNILKNIINSTDDCRINNTIDNIIEKEVSKLEAKGISDIEKKKVELSRLPRYKNGVGLPIGNETSQILAIYYLNGVKLKLNRKTQIYDMKRGFNFLGYKFFLKGKKLIVLINNQTKKRIKRKLRKLKKKNFPKYVLVKASYNGYFMKAHCGSFIFKSKI